MAAGSALFGARAFAGTAPAAPSALLGLIAGMLLKWLLLGGGLIALLALYRLPAAPVIAGFIVAQLANLVAWRFKD